MTYLQEGSQEEDSLEDTLVEEESHWVEDLLEEDGDPHRFKYLNCNMEN